MKRTIFSFTAVLALIASLGVGLYPEPSLSMEIPDLTTAVSVNWYQTSGQTSLILASAWNPLEGELYIVVRGISEPNNLWLGSFNALGDFIDWKYIRRVYNYTDPATGQHTGTINLGPNPSASMSWNTATQEMYLMIPDVNNRVWVTTVNSAKPAITTQYEVSGLVTNENGGPMSGVYIDASLNGIYVKSSAPTQNNGRYSLYLRGGFSYTLTAWRADDTQVGIPKTVPATDVLSSSQTDVNFSAVPLVTYNLTVNTNPTNGSGGTVATPIPAGAVVTTNKWSYTPGTSVTLTATPNSGYSLSGWTGLVAADEDTSSGNTATVKITRDKTITANFATNTTNCTVVGALVANQWITRISLAAGAQACWYFDIPANRPGLSARFNCNDNITWATFTWTFPGGVRVFPDPNQPNTGEPSLNGNNGEATLALFGQVTGWQANIPDQYIPEGRHTLRINAINASGINAYVGF